MSFADLVREELCSAAIKSPCCQRALTAGLILCAEEDEKRMIRVRYKHEVVATLASAMIRRQYGKAPDSTMTGACGHRYYDLFFSSPAAHKYLSHQRAEGASVETLVPLACEGCRSAFLRGAFLASGTVNDPHKSFHLEFILPDEERAAYFEGFLRDCGRVPRRMKRQSGIGVYFKGSEDVEELITLTGAQTTVFEIINSRIERSIRNDENRATNCVAKNIEKSISAATRQVEAIGHLMEKGRFERLPEKLRVTALLRYRNPDATLDELVALHDTPISKSGLNHRLMKLLEAAEDCR